MKRMRDLGEPLPGCTVRQTATAHAPREEDVMDEVDSTRFAQAGRYGLRLLIGTALALFAGFLYLFNFTAFF